MATSRRFLSGLVSAAPALIPEMGNRLSKNTSDKVGRTRYRVVMQTPLGVDLQFYVYLAARIVVSLETTSGLSLNNSSTIFFTSSPVNGLTSRLVFLVSARNSGSVRVFMNALRRI